tara:strand:+ start:359 stop:1477 length:1119 start_codon:yes stop_codon:yes gene_type:complete
MSVTGSNSGTNNNARIGVAGQGWDLYKIYQQDLEDGTVLPAGEGACDAEERSWVECLVDQLLEEGGDGCEHLCDEMVRALVDCQDEAHALETKLAWLQVDLRAAISRLGDAVGEDFNPDFWWRSLEVKEVESSLNVLKAMGVYGPVIDAFKEFQKVHAEVEWKRERLHSIHCWLVLLDPGTLGGRGVEHGWLREYRKSLHKAGASFHSQDSIFDHAVESLPLGCVHVSGGLADANGLSDVDILLPREISEEEVKYLPKGSWEKESKPGRRLFSIPGYDREVNLYASADPAARQSIRHRETMLALEKGFPLCTEKAYAYKAAGSSSEGAWALVLDLSGDRYKAMEDTEKVLQIAEVHEAVYAKLAAKREAEKS